MPVRSIRASYLTVASVGLSLVCFAILIYEVWSFTADDAFITFRYSMNLATGQGPTFNPGLPPSEGYTTFLWMLLMTVPHLLHLDAVLFSKVVGVICTVAYICIVFLFVRRMTGICDGESRHFPAAAAVLMLASCPATAIHAVSGMETALFTLGMTAFLFLATAHAEHPRRRTAVVLVLVAFLFGLTRPEANLVALIGLALTMTKIPRDQRLFLGRMIVALYVLPGTVYFLWRFIYYGSFLPLPYYVKVASQTLLIGFPEVLSFVRYFGVHIGVLVLLGLLRNDTRLRAILWVVVSMLFFFTIPRHIMGYQWRYLFPVAPLVIVFAAQGFALLRSWVLGWEGQSRALRQIVIWGTVFVVWAGFLSDAPRMIAEKGAYATGMTTAHIALGKRLALLSAVKDHPLLVIGDAGAAPYYSGWRTVDIYALSDAYIARTSHPDPQYVLSKKPDLVVFRSDSRESFEPHVEYETELYHACLEGGMVRLVTLVFDEHYYLWVMGSRESPLAPYVSAWEQMPPG